MKGWYSNLIRFYDTNKILELGEKILDELDDKNPIFYLSSTTLLELEDIKVNSRKTDDIKYKARAAVRFLSKNENKYQVIIFGEKQKKILEVAGLTDSPDNQICACAYYLTTQTIQDVVFVTSDLCCKIIARNIFELTVEDTSVKEDIYKGYKKITGNTDHINEVMNNIDFSDWYINEYLIIENTDDGSVKEMKYDGNGLVVLKLPPSKYIKGKNALQRCALDMMNNPNITICAVLGGYGSGKSKLTTKMALYQVLEKGNHSKINIIREPKGEGDSVGFLKGTFEEKTDQFFLPISQQLEGGEFEMESLKQRGILEAHIPYYCKGLTFSDSVTIVDEAEDLNEKQIRLIGTRIGENSRIFLNGDYKQSIIKANQDNALIKMCNELKGNPMFATVYLGEDVRSETSKLFSHIFE